MSYLRKCLPSFAFQAAPTGPFYEVAVALWKRGNADLRRRLKSLEQLKSVSAANMKRICLEALSTTRYTFFLEHVGFSTQPLSGEIKQLAGESSLHLIFAARSFHMENAGYLVRRTLISRFSAALRPARAAFLTISSANYCCLWACFPLHQL
jgi:hypothetical protein